MRILFGWLALCLFVSLPAAAQIQSPIRINCGGSAYTDSKGQLWEADTGYKGGEAVSANAAIAGTTEPELYRNARKFPVAAKSSVEYSFALPNGPYHVNLYFAETDAAHQKIGARVFNVSMQNERIFSNLDIFAEAGAHAALIKSTDVKISDSQLIIQFTNLVSSSIISAIEIIPGTSGPQLSLDFKYPDGTPVVGTLRYVVTSTLLSFQGAVPLNHGEASCALFANPSSLGLSMQFTVKISLVDTAGKMLWTLNLLMDPSGVNLAAVQSSTLSVIVQKL